MERVRWASQEKMGSVMSGRTTRDLSAPGPRPRYSFVRRLPLLMSGSQRGERHSCRRIRPGSSREIREAGTKLAATAKTARQIATNSKVIGS